MKSFRRRCGCGSYRELAAYGICGGIAILVCLAAGGIRGFVSSFLAFAIYALPSAAILLVSRRMASSNPMAGALVLQIGLFVRLFLATGLIVVVALAYKELNWPAFLLTLFIVASSPMASQLLFKK